MSRMEPHQPESDPGESWLRDLVGEELIGLFSEDRDDVATTVSRLLERLPFDQELENSLIDALQTSVDYQNDDTQGSVWISLLLGEAAVLRAIPTLIQALHLDEDEELQAAAGIAILRCGEPGVDALLEGIDDDSPSPVFLQAAFRLLGCVGYLRDAPLRHKVMTFLADTLENEVVKAESLPLVEGIAHAAAWLGHTELAPRLKEIHERHFHGRNVALADAVEMLESNTAAAPVVGQLLPGEEEYHWAFEYRGESFRPGAARGMPEVLAMARGAEMQGLANDDPDEYDRARQEIDDIDTLYRGLGGEEAAGDDDGEW